MMIQYSFMELLPYLVDVIYIIKYVSRMKRNELQIFKFLIIELFKTLSFYQAGFRV